MQSPERQTTPPIQPHLPTVTSTLMSFYPPATASTKTSMYQTTSLTRYQTTTSNHAEQQCPQTSRLQVNWNQTRAGSPTVAECPNNKACKYSVLMTW